MPSPILELYSQTHYVADGTTTTWNFSFAGGYISKDHVKAYRVAVGGELPIIVPLLPTDISAAQVSIVPAITAGQKLVIYRDTPKDQPLVNYTDGQVYSEAALDLSARQAVFIAAEVADIAGQALNVGGGVVELQELLQGGQGAAYVGFSLSGLYPAGTVGAAFNDAVLKSSATDQTLAGNVVVRRNDAAMVAQRTDDGTKLVQLRCGASEALLEYGSGYPYLSIPGQVLMVNVGLVNLSVSSSLALSAGATQTVAAGAVLRVAAGGTLTLTSLPTNPADAANKQYVDNRASLDMLYFGITGLALTATDSWQLPTPSASTLARVGTRLSLGSPLRARSTVAGTHRMRGRVSITLLSGTTPTAVKLRPSNDGSYWNPEIEVPMVSGTTGKIDFEFATPGVPANTDWGLAVQLVGANGTTNTLISVSYITQEFFPT